MAKKDASTDADVTVDEAAPETAAEVVSAPVAAIAVERAGAGIAEAPGKVDYPLANGDKLVIETF